jgi:hypothetical protein
VIGDDKEGLPTSVAGLAGIGLGLYARRWPLYLSLAVLGIAVNAIVNRIDADIGLLLGLNVVLQAFIAATVSIGVGFDLAGKEADWSRLITAASLRWGVVALLTLLLFAVQQFFLESLYLPPDETAYGFLLVMLVLIWAALLVATVAGAIEPAQSRWMLPLAALGKGFGVSTRLVNLGRLMLLAVLVTLPLLAELIVDQQLQARGAPVSALFWVDIPIDMLTLGPLQAIATLCYVDFLRRAKR